jgi:predicted nucleic acid-binding protein
LYLSVISELELLSYKKITQKEVKIITAFLSEVVIENITPQIKQYAIEIRKSTNLKLPDCIIAATSIYLGIPLITSDRQLSSVKGLDIVLFEK